jgi:hypothetical protein
MKLTGRVSSPSAATALLTKAPSALPPVSAPTEKLTRLSDGRRLAPWMSKLT